MRLLELARKDVLMILRDRTALIFVILVPLALTLIVGSALGKAFKEPEAALGGPFAVAVADEDQGALGRGLVELLERPEVSRLLRVVRTSAAGADRDLVAGKVAASVVIPAGFTERVASGRQAAVEVRSNSAHALQGSVLKSVVTSYTDALSVAQATASSVGFDGGLIRIANRMAEPARGVNAFQYYAAAIGAMFCFFAANSSGSKSFLGEREDGTLARLLTTPTRRWEIIGGKLVGTLLVAVLQMTTMVVATALIYRIDWGDSLLGLAVMILALGVGASGLSVFIASLARSTKAAELLSAIVIQLNALLGGSYMALNQLPEFARTISHFTFNGQANAGFLALMEGRPLASIAVPAVALTSVGLIMAVAGARRLST